MIKLRPVLKNLGINQVVSIDDDYDVEISEELKNEEISSYESSIELTSSEKAYLYDSGYLLIAELNDTEEMSRTILEKIINYVKENQEANDRTSPLIWLENAILEIDSETLKYEKLSKSSSVKLVSEENTLWILDKDMKGSDSIFNSISMINDTFQNTINIFAIYTHDYTLEALNNEWEKRFIYLKNLGFSELIANNLAYEFYVICKPRNPKQPEKAIFKKVIFNSIIGHTMNSVYQDMKCAKNKVLNQFEELTKNVTFESLSTFRYNVENEGEHNVYKLMNNVMNLMELQNYQEFMMQDINYINAFKKIISNTKGKSQSEERLDTLNLINKEYLWNKYQYIDTDVNLGYEDIQFGDVFDITLSEFYKYKYKLSSDKVIGVVITQSCDCIVRKDTGTRKESMIKILLFNEENEINTTVSEKIFNNGIFLFKNSGNLPNSYILNNSSIGILFLDDAILDLTSLNRNGEAFILEDSKLKYEIELKKPVIWDEKMFDNLRKDRILGNDIEKQKVKIRKSIIEARYGIKYTDAKKEFQIKRIGRLTYNNAHTIMSYYINNMGRIGKESPNTLSFQDIHNE